MLPHISRLITYLIIYQSLQYNFTRRNLILIANINKIKPISQLKEMKIDRNDVLKERNLLNFLNYANLLVQIFFVSFQWLGNEFERNKINKNF